MLVWVAIALALVTWWWRRELRKYESLDRLPGPRRLPILGNVMEFTSSDTGLFFKKMRLWANSYKDIYVLWLLNKPVINIYNPEDIEIVLSSSTLITKSFLYRFAEPWLLRGILLNDGSQWQTRRKMLTPAFHFYILKVYSESIEENTWKLVDRLRGELNNDATDIRSLVKKFALDSLCETTMGTKLDDKQEKGSNYMKNIAILGNIVFQRTSNFWLHSGSVFNNTSIGKQYQKLLKEVHGFTVDVIDQRRKYMNEHSQSINDDIATAAATGVSKRKLAMLDLLLQLERQGAIDAHGIHEEMENFMFAGHETTFVAITYLLLLLANHEEYQNRVYAELEEIFGTELQPASMDDLNKLPFLTACMRESLRLFPSAPLIGRLLTHEVQLKSCKVPAGTACHIHIMDLHRRADLWDDPLVFRPERFLSEVELQDRRHPFAYIPFSAGPRNCIGQKYAMLEVKSAVAAILRNYRLLPVTRMDGLKFRADGVLRPMSPVNINFQPRRAMP